MAIKKKKLVLKIFCGVFGVWLLFLALTPTLLSQGGLQYLMNRKVDGEFKFTKAKLSWFTSQQIEGIEYQNPTLGLDFSIDLLKTKASLWDLLIHPKDLKRTEIKGLDGVIEFDKSKETSLLANLDSSEPLHTSHSTHDTPPYLIFSFPFRGKFDIDHSKLTFKSSEYEPITFDKIQLNCNMVSKSGPLLANLACETTQNELSGSAFLNLELGGFDKESKIIFTPFDRDLLFLSPKGYVQLNAQLTNLPTEGLDHLALLYHPKFEGLLSSLFGDSLNLGSEINMVKGKSNLNIMADAPNMDLKFSGSVVQNEFFLNEASICNLKITPDFVEALSRACHLDSPLKITSQTLASIHLDRLSIPLDFKNFNLNALSCNAQFSLGEMNFSKDSFLKDLKVQKIKGAIDTFDIGENVTFHLSAFADDQGQPMVVKADGQISKLLQIQDEQGVEQLQGSCQLQLQDIPSHFLTLLSKQKLFFNEILGPTTSLNLNFKGSPKEGSLILGLSSSRLSLEEAVFELTQNTRLNLIKASPLNYRFNPSFAKLVFNPKLTLLHPFEVQGKLKTLALSLDSNEDRILDINLKLSSNPFETSYENSKPIHIKDTQVYLSKNEDEKLEAKAYFTAILTENSASSPVGNFFNFSLLFKDVPIFVKKADPQLVGLIKGKKFSAEFGGRLDSNLNFELTEKLKAEIQPTCAQFQDFSFSTSSPLQLEIEPCSLSFQDLAQGSVQVSGTLISDHLLCSHDEKEFPVEELCVHFDYTGGKRGSFNFQASAMQERVNLNGTLHDVDLFQPSKPTLELEGKLSDFSSTFLNFITDRPESFFPLIGEKFHLDFTSKGQVKKDAPQKVSYQFKTQTLQSSGEFTIEKDLFLNEPLSFQYHLTPEALLELSTVYPKLSCLTLTQPTEVKFILNRLQKRRKNSCKWPEAFEGEIHIEEILTTQGEIRHLEGHFETPNLNEIFKFQMHAHSLLNSRPGEILFKADLIEPLKEDSWLPLEKLNGLFSCQLHYFPSRLLKNILEPLSPHYSQLNTLLGPVFNLNSTLKLVDGEGPLKLDVESDFFNTETQLHIVQGHLTLKDDLVATMRLTPDLSKNWLHKVNPLLISAVSCDVPLKLTLSKEGFSIPLHPFSLEGISLPSGTLELGKITLKEEGHLGQIYALFNQKPKDDQFKSCFTPCHFSLQNGVLSLKSNHLKLADKFHLALWGTWDFNRKENTFYLGLPTSTLHSLFGLSRLPSEYVFQIPLEQKEGLLKADWRLARKQLSILTSASSPFVSNKTGEDSSISLDQIMEIVAQSHAAPSMHVDKETFPWLSTQTETPQQEEPPQKEEQKSTSKILYNFLVEVKKKLAH